MDARLRQTTLWGTWVALVASCGGTSTGNPYDRGTGGEHSGNSGQCEEQRAMELELDAESELGFSARDVLDHAGEQREETLRWRALNGVSYGPESGTQALTFGITPTGKARFVEYVPKSSGFEIASDCGEQLEIPVEVTLQSAQGALDERFTTVLTARSVELGRIYHRLKAEDLGGSLELTASDGFEFTELSVSIQTSRFGVQGSLTPSLQKTSGDSVAQSATGTLASWGPEGCEAGMRVPSDAAVADFSADDALALLTQHTDAAAAWKGGEATTVEFSFEPGLDGACAVLEQSAFAPPGADGAVGTLRIPGTLQATTADGLLNASWSATLTAKPNEHGALSGLALEVLADAAGGAHGFTDADVSAYDFANVRAMLTLSAAGAWSGDASLTGYESANCPPPQVEEMPGGAAGAPGCPGATPHEIARLSLGD